MSAATVPSLEGVHWRPSAALRVARRPAKKRSLTATVLAALIAFMLTLAAAGPASAAVALFPETAVATQTHSTTTLIGPETPARPVFVGVQGLAGYDGSLGCCVAPRVTSWLDEAATAKVPDGWGAGRPNNSGVGTRWTDPANQGNGIRIDQGNLLNTQATQQVDHVVVRSGGEVLGRDGRPIVGSIKDNYDTAHIPLDEWLTWSSWNSP